MKKNLLGECLLEFYKVEVFGSFYCNSSRRSCFGHIGTALKVWVSSVTMLELTGSISARSRNFSLRKFPWLLWAYGIFVPTTRHAKWTLANFSQFNTSEVLIKHWGEKQTLSQWGRYAKKEAEQLLQRFLQEGVTLRDFPASWCPGRSGRYSISFSD